MTSLWAFLVMAIVLSVTPGPDDVVVLRNTLRGGAPWGLMTAFGVALGDVAWGVATAIGLAVAIARSPVTYMAVRAAGAAYLLFLGLASLRVRRPTPGGRVRTTVPEVREQAWRCPQALWSTLTIGALSGLLNPKVGLFYLAVVPQFVPAGAPILQYSLMLCAIEIVVATVWLALVALLGGLAVRRVRSPTGTGWYQRCVGAVLIGIGAAAALHL